MKICSVYGAGFYFIPGTDTCIKVGGYVRMDIGLNAAGSHGPYIIGAAARDTRVDTPYYQSRTRGVVTMDARSQTEWGTLRAYIRAGWEMNSASTYTATNAVTVDTTYRGLTYWDRAFLQFAGLTVGKTQSFFDFYANALNYTTSITGGSDTGHGINLLAYTFTFGGGFSGTISLEDTVHRRTGLWDASSGALLIGAFPAGGNFQLNAAAPQPAGDANNPVIVIPLGALPNGIPGAPNYGDYGAATYPDVVANLRVDQPWGSAQIMGALHNVNAGCFGASCNGFGAGNAGNGAVNIGPDAIGGAIGAGVMFNLPWAQGDQLWIQGTYARGAASYLGLNKFVANDTIAMYNGGVPVNAGGNGNVGLAWAFDGIFCSAPVAGANGTPCAGGATGVALTEGFQVNAAIQHFWTPSLRTSVFGGYVELDFPGQATTNFCSGLSSGAGQPPVQSFGQAAGAANPGGVGGSPLTTCDPSFALWQIGTRTIWSPVRNLDIGVEVLYTRLDQNHVGNWNLGSSGSRAAGLYNAADQDTWSGLIRFQRNFWP